MLEDLHAVIIIQYHFFLVIVNFLFGKLFHESFWVVSLLQRDTNADVGPFVRPSVCTDIVNTPESTSSKVWLWKNNLFFWHLIEILCHISSVDVCTCNLMYVKKSVSLVKISLVKVAVVVYTCSFVNVQKNQSH